MEVIRARSELRASCDEARMKGATVGFVPTMGYLHDGHMSLMRRARSEAGHVAVSVFVNPLQFGPSEDLGAYPRDMDRDLELCAAEGVDVTFVPAQEEMYPAGAPEVTVDPGPAADRLEGASRPGHFRGVCTVVAKLLSLVGACRAYFGEKDAQQLFVIRRMAADLDMPVDVVGVPTVREPDGLAMSSRNVYLAPDERRAATCLYESLERAASLVREGETDTAAIEAEIRARIEREPLASIDYVAVVDDESFREVARIGSAARAVVAARVGPARLIDNLRLDPAVEDNPSEA